MAQAAAACAFDLHRGSLDLPAGFRIIIAYWLSAQPGRVAGNPGQRRAASRFAKPELAALAPIEIFAVDDGSTDGSAAVLRDFDRPGAKVTMLSHTVNQGLGRTMLDGLHRAASTTGPDDVVITMDADNTHPAERIPLMVQQIRDGAGVVIASRYRRGSRVAGLTALRSCLSLVCNTLFSLMAPMAGVRDYTCGYRAIKAGLLHTAMASGLELVTETGFASTAEILLKLRGLGPVCREVPLVLRYDRKCTPSKMRITRTSVDLLRMLWSSRRWPSAVPREPQKPRPAQNTDAR